MSSSRSWLQNGVIGLCLATRTLALMASVGFAEGVFAQSSALHRSVLQDLAFPIPGCRTITTRLAVDRNGAVSPHTHPGIETAYVVAGDAEVSIENQTPRALHAGDSFAILKDVVHAVRNIGTGQLIIISTYVVDKNAALVIPVAPEH